MFEIQSNHSFIKNHQSLLEVDFDLKTIEARKIALEIINEGIKAADPKKAIHDSIKLVKSEIKFSNGSNFLLSDISRLFVIGAGKATAMMAEALEKILGQHIHAGQINVPENSVKQKLNLKNIQYNIAGHPLVTSGTISGTKKIIEMIDELSSSDLVICLISGGGSALLELPVEGITLEDLSELFHILTEVGATIHELNTIRKHISQVKGGKLAQLIQPAKVISLVISDVIGDTLDTIASGPTAPDLTSWHTTEQIINKYGIMHKLPLSVQQVVKEGLTREINETLKPDNSTFANVENIIIASNTKSCNAMKEYANQKKYSPIIISTEISGEAREVGKEFAEKAKRMDNNSVLIAGGETTVTIQGNGLGGRNQELALAASQIIAGKKRIVIASLGSDGIDGPTDAAGALVDGYTALSGSKMKLEIDDFLNNNDSFNFLKQTNNLIFTGPTGTNVMDFIVVVKSMKKKS
ncbi:MAG: glycerate kinase [Candidatus Heimdallarchaeota archaeon]|nr:glycerate kinase [Candidatus Heimdallarchaeota archaeon]MBY8996029.1 glycerate kinase [Candidatus Heimdallarchaeota archaeon]